MAKRVTFCLPTRSARSPYEKASRIPDKGVSQELVHVGHADTCLVPFQGCSSNH
jgi:hypothetical protein